MNSSSGSNSKLLNLLALASELLGSSLNFENTALQTCVVCVPQLSDWSCLFVLDEKSSKLNFSHCVHYNAAEHEPLKNYFLHSTPFFIKRPAVINALRLGKVVTELCAESSKVSGFLLHLPLIQRSQVIGVLTLGSQRAFSLEDVQIAEVISHRASSALDNSRMYQRSCLIENELLLAKKKAEEANKAKSDLLANVSHEIRSPVGAILGFADLLLIGGQTEQEREEWIQRIKHNGHHLLRLINDILNLAKVESGQYTIENQLVDFSELFSDLEITHINKAREKNIEFALNLQSPVPESFFTDPTRLQQILNNVIGNALKFTENGYVHVNARYDKNSGFLFFDVEDTGPGLTIKQGSQIFQPFVQAGTEHSKRHGGTGLGLALSMKLARLLGGDLELLYSEPQKGSKFRILIKPKISPQFPFVTELKKKLQFYEPETEKKEIKLNGKKILVVDDSVDNQYLIKTLLTIKGADVNVASSGEEVLSISQIHNYDIILMDIQMPGKNGYETTAELRQSGFTKPIIALTANALPGDLELSLKSGCDRHVTKPVDNNELLKMISELIFI